MAAGPGRPAEPSTRTLPLDGTQKVETSVAGWGVTAERVALGATPVSLNERQVASPKQPGLAWPGQKRPLGFDFELVPS
jgi:hypothetical protein